jgi:hypothetical protein
MHFARLLAMFHGLLDDSSFHVAQRFRPMTVERPKVLLPLVNVPMINYTLEWLLASGVDEVRRSYDVPRLTQAVLQCTSLVDLQWHAKRPLQLATGTCTAALGVPPSCIHRLHVQLDVKGHRSNYVRCRSWCSAARTRRRCSGT